MAEMYVPISLLESTKNMPKQIFDAISLEDMRSLMRQSFSDESLIDTFSIFSSFTQNCRETAMEEAVAGKRPRIKAEILFTKVQVNLSPNKLNDVAGFLEYAENIKISEELMTYRPLQRPITNIKPNESAKRKRKRKLIVRDWFYFVVWAIRLKKLLKSAPSVKESREKKLEEYRKLYDKQSKGKDNHEMKNLEEYMKKMKKKIEAEIAKNEEEKANSEKKITGMKVTLRCQEFALRCFPAVTNQVVPNTIPKHPIMELQVIVNFRISF